jgi:signal transduction histidine kinase
VNLNKIKSYLPYFTDESVIPIKLYLYSVPSIIFFTVVVEADLENFHNILQWTIATIYSILITVIFVLFYKYVVFSYAKHESIPVIQVIIYAILLGSVKGSSTYYFSFIMGLHDHGLESSHIFSRLIPAIVIALVYVPNISWIHSSLERFQKLRIELMTKSAKVHIENQSYKNLIEESKLTLKNKMNEIFGEIKNELQKIENNASFDEEWPKIAKLVRKTAVLEIRPESHNLWASQTKKFRSLTFYDFLKSALRLNPFPTKLVIPLYYITASPQLFIKQPKSAISIIVIGSILIFLIFSVGNYLNRHLVKNFKQNYAFIMIVLSLATYFNAKFTNLYFGITFNLASFLIGMIWFLIISIVCSLVTTVGITKKEILTEIEDSLREQETYKSTLAQIENRINAKLAKFLHGYVQARLMSNALQLEVAEKNQDNELALKEINRLTKDLVDEYGIMDQLKYDLPFNDEIEKIKESWSGICEIDIIGFRHLKIDQLIIKDFIEDAISEAIANSVRHGLADKIRIQFSKMDSEDFEIQVIDNGVGPISNQPGMGSEIFDLLSQDSWRLISNVGEKGSTLILPVKNIYQLQISEKVGN